MQRRQGKDPGEMTPAQVALLHRIRDEYLGDGPYTEAQMLQEIMAIFWQAAPASPETAITPAQLEAWAVAGYVQEMHAVLRDIAVGRPTTDWTRQKIRTVLEEQFTRQQLRDLLEKGRCDLKKAPHEPPSAS